MAEDFTFAHVQGGFDEHIKLSIRNYDQLLEDVVDFSRYYVENESNVLVLVNSLICYTILIRIIVATVTILVLKLLKDFKKI